MRTTYILDTSVLLYDPCTYKSFPNSDVIIPVEVLNELDKQKKFSNEKGKNARICDRLLDEISNRGDISIGVLLDSDILLSVDTLYRDMSDPTYKGFGDPTYGDTHILACAYSTWLNHPEHDVTLVSNDINLRIKARARGINAISHNNSSRYALEDLYTGVKIINNEDAGMTLQKNNIINPSEFNIDLPFPNQCVLFEDSSGNGIAMGRRISQDKIKLVKKNYPWSLASRNKEQTFAIDLILDKSVDLVTLTGTSGSGKSICAIAAALEMVLNRKEYEKLIIYRPIIGVDDTLGWLPGTLEEKLSPWFQAIIDNMEVLFANKHGGDWKKDLEMYQKKGKIEFEAISYIRGRSIPNAIILVDENQNLTSEQIKTILTRVGEGTKVILTGDLEQIDTPNLDAINNGLTYVIEKFKTSEIAGHVTFTKGERSRLATEASKIL